MSPLPPNNVKSAIESAPDAPRRQLLALREIIFDAGEATDTLPLTETLKWGQPSYLPTPESVGTTLRMGWSKKAPETVGLYVHCQSTLVSEWREIYAETFVFVGNRGVLIPIDKPIPKTAVHQMAAMALTYHTRKKAKTEWSPIARRITGSTCTLRRPTDK